jgi:hypothetical protein
MDRIAQDGTRGSATDARRGYLHRTPLKFEASAAGRSITGRRGIPELPRSSSLPLEVGTERGGDAGELSAVDRVSSDGPRPANLLLGGIPPSLCFCVFRHRYFDRRDQGTRRTGSPHPWSAADDPPPPDQSSFDACALKESAPTRKISPCRPDARFAGTSLQHEGCARIGGATMEPAKGDTDSPCSHQQIRGAENGMKDPITADLAARDSRK